MNQRDMKTVIVLDRNAKFLDNCEEKFTFSVREGPKQGKISVEKTLWTSCLEGIFEAHRILSDVYPQGSIALRFAVADHMGKMLDSAWEERLLSRGQLATLFEENVKVPNLEDTDITLTSGLTMAIEALAVETPQQKDYNYRVKYDKKSRTSSNSEVRRFQDELTGHEALPKVENNGNLVIYTRLKTQEEMDELEKEVVSLVKSRNKIATSPSNETFCPITSLRLFIVNYYTAETEKGTVRTHPLKENPDLSILKTWVISRRADQMPDAIHSLLVAAFDMGTTTVTKIPMKEDNRGSSNYDVELFHSKKVHYFLQSEKLLSSESDKGCAEQGVTYDSMRLTWTTAPKTKWRLFPFYRDSVPCTTAQAYSRPSACLTQFVRDGRCVLLDLDKKAEYGMNVADKLISHALLVNRGRIFIQMIDFLQKTPRIVGTLQHPRLIRSPEKELNLGQMNHVYNQMRLKMVGKNFLKEEMTEKEREKKREIRFADIEERFRLVSRNIPMYRKDTFIFNEGVQMELEPLITYFTHKKMKPEEVEKCQAKILELLQMRQQDEYIFDPDQYDIGDCSVNDLDDPSEQMRVALVELTKHMRNYVRYSETHHQLFKTFMTTLGVEKLMANERENQDPADQKAVAFPFFGRNRDSLKESAITKFVKRRRIEVEEKAHEIPKEQRMQREKEYKMAERVELSIFAKMCEKIELKESKIRREFVGRETHGLKAPLYEHLIQEKMERSSSPGGERAERVRNADRGGSGTPPPGRRAFNS